MKYTTSHITYHWMSFALILLMAGSGMAYSYDLVGDGAMRLHQIAGQILIVILALRLVSRLTTPVTRTSDDQSNLQRRLAGCVHLGLYLVMIAYVATGYVSASAETNSALLAPVDLAFARSDTGEWLLDMHYLLKWVLLALVGLHVAAALKHHFWDQDTTLTQMTYKARKG